jgi:hypothetical protein
VVNKRSGREERTKITTGETNRRITETEQYMTTTEMSGMLA